MWALEREILDLSRGGEMEAGEEDAAKKPLGGKRTWCYGSSTLYAAQR